MPGRQLVMLTVFSLFLGRERVILAVGHPMLYIQKSKPNNEMLRFNAKKDWLPALKQGASEKSVY